MSLNRDICKKMTDVKCCVFKVSDYIFLPHAPKIYNNVVKNTNLVTVGIMIKELLFLWILSICKPLANHSQTITETFPYSFGNFRKLSLCEPRQANLCLRAFRHDKF